MPLPEVATTWNGPLGGGASVGVAWAKVGLDQFAQRYADALNERVAAAWWHRGPWPNPGDRVKRDVSPKAFEADGDNYEYGPVYSAVVPAPGYDSFRFHPEPNAPLVVGGHPTNGGYWNRLQRKLGGVQVTVFGGTVFSTGLMRLFGDFSTTAGLVSLFLPADALRRKFPREIWTLSAAGQKDWVARFSVHLGTPDCQTQLPWPQVALHRQPVTTPEAERVHAGRIFVHNGNAWQLAADQTLRPDVVTMYGFAEEGDTFGPWIAADVRTQLHRMQETFVSDYYNFSGLPPDDPPRWDPHYFYSRLTITIVGDTYSNVGGNEEEYASGENIKVQAGPDPYRFDGFKACLAPLAWRNQEVPFNNNFGMGRCVYRCFSDRLPLPPMGAGCKARGYVWAESMAVLIPNGVLHMPFSSHGDPVSEDAWTAMGPVEDAHGTYQSPQVGSLDMPGGTFAGYAGKIGLWMRWNVEGGFRFSPLSE